MPVKAPPGEKPIGIVDEPELHQVEGISKIGAVEETPQWEKREKSPFAPRYSRRAMQKREAQKEKKQKKEENPVEDIFAKRYGKVKIEEAAKALLKGHLEAFSDKPIEKYKAKKLARMNPAKFLADYSEKWGKRKYLERKDIPILMKHLREERMKGSISIREKKKLKRRLKALKGLGYKPKPKVLQKTIKKPSPTSSAQRRKSSQVGASFWKRLRGL